MEFNQYKYIFCFYATANARTCMDINWGKLRQLKCVHEEKRQKFNSFRKSQYKNNLLLPFLRVIEFYRNHEDHSLEQCFHANCYISTTKTTCSYMINIAQWRSTLRKMCNHVMIFKLVINFVCLKMDRSFLSFVLKE